MDAVAIALAAAACWGVADFLAGLASRRRSAIVVLLVQQLTGVVVAGAIIVASGTAAPSTTAIVLSAAGGVSGAIALGAFYRGLAVGTMSIVAPISATGVTLPVVVGIATGDRPGALQAIGLVLAVTGVVLASREAEEEALPQQRRSVVLALIAAAGLGLYFVLSDGAADESVLWLLFVARATASVVLTGAALATGAFASSPAPDRRAWGMLVLIGLLDLAATALFGIASTKGLISIVAVVGALYPVSTVLLARVVLRERLARAQAAGVALAFTGVAAVAAGAA